MIMKYHRLVSILFSLFFLGSSLSIILTSNPTSNSLINNKPNFAYTPHSYISISSEANLISFPDKSGSGTLNDPYIIEGFEFNIASNEYGISLELIKTLYLTIRNCRFILDPQNLITPYGNGIIVNNCNNINISFNEFITTNKTKSTVGYSEISGINNSVQYNSFQNCSKAIYVSSSFNGYYSHNFINQSRLFGIEYYPLYASSSNSIIKNNTIYGCNEPTNHYQYGNQLGYGIFINGGTNNNGSVLNNNIDYTYTGIQCMDNNNFIENNNVSNCIYGISLNSCKYTIIQNNTLSNNGKGIIASGTEVTICYNLFLNSIVNGYEVSQPSQDIIYGNTFYSIDGLKLCLITFNSAYEYTLPRFYNNHIGNYWCNYETLHPNAGVLTYNNIQYWDEHYDVIGYDLNPDLNNRVDDISADVYPLTNSLINTITHVVPSNNITININTPNIIISWLIEDDTVISLNTIYRIYVNTINNTFRSETYWRSGDNITALIDSTHTGTFDYVLQSWDGLGKSVKTSIRVIINDPNQTSTTTTTDSESSISTTTIIIIVSLIVVGGVIGSLAYYRSRCTSSTSNFTCKYGKKYTKKI